MFENLMWELKGAMSAGIMSLAKTTGNSESSSGKKEEPPKERFHGLSMVVKKLDVIDTFNRLTAIGTPEKEAEKDANLIYDCKYLGLDLLDERCVDTIISKTKCSKDEIDDARYAFQLLMFLRENGITSLDDLEFVGMISSLLNTEKGELKDCDTVAAEHGLPLEPVIYVSSLLKKFSDNVNQQTEKQGGSGKTDQSIHQQTEKKTKRMQKPMSIATPDDQQQS